MTAIMPAAWTFIALTIAAASPAAAQNALDRAVRPVTEADKGPPAPDAPRPPAIHIEAPAVPNAAGTAIDVGAIVISGLQVLSPVDFADLLATRIGRTLDPQALGELTSRIAERARERGYVFASARIEPQRVSTGVLTISVDEGVIAAVRIEGPDHAGVRAALQPLLNGTPATIDAVERRLLIAGDLDGVYVRSSRYVREGGRGVLIVQLSTDHLSGRATLANDSTRTLGPEQARLDLNISAILAHDDALAFTYLATPAEPDELQYVRARYRKRVSAAGTELGVTASYSAANPGAYLRSYDIHSRSWFAGATMLHPLLRRRDASLWLEGELGVRNLVQDRTGSKVREDQITVARLGVSGFFDAGGGRLRVNATASLGLGILGATKAGDPYASRDDADGTFSELTAWADWTAPIGGSFSTRVAFQGQLASQPLLVAEEVGLGGAAFLRGYDYSERSGDQGAMASAELRYDWARPFGSIRKLQLYSFVDGGRVTNLKGGYGTGSLVSTGGGVRADVTRTLDAALEVAVPLSGPRYDTGDEAPKLNFRLSRSF